MSGFLALCRKNLTESRWMLGLMTAALFALSWLTVFITALTEERFRQARRSLRGNLAFRGMGGAMGDLTSVAIEVAWWNHPFILVNVLVWAIARGSLAVAGELERGTLDLILARPVARSSYILAHALTALGGLALMAGALVGGNLLGGRFHAVETPPTALALGRAALNLTTLGLAIYGLTLAVSAVDRVRWRPNLVASVFTLASFILLVLANVPVLEAWKWLERFSIFHAFDPVAAAVHGRDLARNAGVLAGLGLGGVLAALAAFAYRDLPSAG